MGNNELPEHFWLAPSSSSRWLQCPGSLKASAHVKDEGGEAADRGTLGHYLVEIDLEGLPMEEPQREFLASLPDAVREELEDAVELCVDLVSDMEAPISMYENKIQSNLLEEHGGTIDVIKYDPASGLLHVIDFKFGRVKVDVEDNAQIKCYLVLARQLFPDAKKFIGSIIQPKISDRLQSFEYTNEDLLQHEAAVLEASISDHFKAGDHCLYCPVNSTCQTLAEHLKAQVDDFPDLTELVSEAGDNPSPEQVEQLCKIYKTFKLTENATKGAGDILKRWAKEGRDVQSHGLGLRVTYRRKWGKGAEERLTEVLGDPFQKPQLITVKEASEALGMTRKKFDEEFDGVLESTEITSLIMGRDSKDFPEFD